MMMKSFATPAEWRAWLEREHARAEGLLLRLFKKDSGIASINYDQALDEALCFGWIDGQKKSHDAQSWVQRFTPRRPRSTWSKRNTEHIARLSAAGRLHAAGHREVEAAKADGRWAAAYDSPASMQVPADFVAAVAKVKRAHAVFLTLTRANQFSIAYRLHEAKRPETRAKRKNEIIAMLARGETFHPQKAAAKATVATKPKLAAKRKAARRTRRKG